MPGADIRQSAERLFDTFRDCVPLPGEWKGKRKGKPPSREELQRMAESGLARFQTLAHEERTRARLGIIGRARVAFDLQRRLLEAGYAPQLVKQVLFALLSTVFSGR